ncbi:hypothetical protein [Sphingobium sp. CAP-1]|uniref:hypothetical protein n=1 Tax=Sphingobium sp. CAP-1 TaxID=2676077 RepID=UPI0012BB2465|nr:hypothetical protein [Sphingobium sp. CAP-1]QGP79995.1 hypothetical protein GL174_14135 [Sphingobium sp. CAP-1]
MSQARESAAIIAQFPGIATRLNAAEPIGLLHAYGAPLDGVDSDTSAIQALLDLEARGRSFDIATPVRMCLSTPLLVQDKPFALKGAMPSYSESQGTALTVACADAFDIRNSDGFLMSNAHIRATGDAQASGSIFDFKASETSSSNSGMLLFDNLRIESPWQAYTFRKVFQVQLRAVRIANARGAYAIGINGLNDDAQGNIFEFMGGGTGALRGGQTDHVVFDGGSGSAKFVGWAMNFGRHAIVSKSNTLGAAIAIASITQAPDGSFRIQTASNHGIPNGSVVDIAGVLPAGVINGQWPINYVSPNQFDLDGSEWVSDTYSGGTVQNVQGRDPGFIYAVASGAENITGDAFHLDRGGLLIVGDGYYSTDRGGNIVNQFKTYKGRLKFANCMMRAAGRHGVSLLAGNASFDGCDIVNNGGVYVDPKVHTIASITDNGLGLIRVTTAEPHGCATGDQMRQTRCGSANGSFIITVIDTNVYDCQASAFAAGAIAGVALRMQQVATAIANNGSGSIRITVPAGAFDDGEWVRLAGFGGNANGDFRVIKEDVDHYLLVMGTGGVAPTYTGGYAASGLIQRCSAQVYIGPGIDTVHISGGLIGTDKVGLNRCRYSVIIDVNCKNIIIDSDISLDARSAILNLSASEPTNNIRNRRALPTSKTPSIGDNSTRIATTAFVRNEIGQSIQAQGAMLDKLRVPTPAASKLLILNSSGDAALIDALLDQVGTPSFSAVTPGDLSVAYGSGNIMSWRKIGKGLDVQATWVFTPTYTGAMSGDALFGGFAALASAATALQRLRVYTLPTSVAWPNTADDLGLVMAGAASVGKIMGFKSGATPVALAANAFASGVEHIVRVEGRYVTNL